MITNAVNLTSLAKTLSTVRWRGPSRIQLGYRVTIVIITQIASVTLSADRRARLCDTRTHALPLPPPRYYHTVDL